MRPETFWTALVSVNVLSSWPCPKLHWGGLDLFVYVEVYGPFNPMGPCRACSVYLTTLLLGRFSPISGQPAWCTFFRQKLTIALLESAEGNNRRKYFMIKSPRKNVADPMGANLQPPSHQSDAHATEPTRLISGSLKKWPNTHEINVWIYNENVSLQCPSPVHWL